MLYIILLITLIVITIVAVEHLINVLKLSLTVWNSLKPKHAYNVNNHTLCWLQILLCASYRPNPANNIQPSNLHWANAANAPPAITSILVLIALRTHSIAVLLINQAPVCLAKQAINLMLTNAINLLLTVLHIIVMGTVPNVNKCTICSWIQMWGE